MEGYELKPITLARIQDKALSRTTDWKKIQFVSLIYKQELPVAHGSLKLCPKTRAIRRAGDRVTGTEVIRPLSFIKRY